MTAPSGGDSSTLLRAATVHTVPTQRCQELYDGIYSTESEEYHYEYDDDYSEEDSALRKTESLSKKDLNRQRLYAAKNTTRDSAPIGISMDASRTGKNSSSKYNAVSWTSSDLSPRDKFSTLRIRHRSFRVQQAPVITDNLICANNFHSTSDACQVRPVTGAHEPHRISSPYLFTDMFKMILLTVQWKS